MIGSLSKACESITVQILPLTVETPRRKFQMHLESWAPDLVSTPYLPQLQNRADKSQLTGDDNTGSTKWSQPQLWLTRAHIFLRLPTHWSPSANPAPRGGGSLLGLQSKTLAQKHQIINNKPPTPRLSPPLPKSRSVRVGKDWSGGPDT